MASSLYAPDDSMALQFCRSEAYLRQEYSRVATSALRGQRPDGANRLEELFAKARPFPEELQVAQTRIAASASHLSSSRRHTVVCKLEQGGQLRTGRVCCRPQSSLALQPTRLSAAPDRRVRQRFLLVSCSHPWSPIAVPESGVLIVRRRPTCHRVAIIQDTT